MTSAIKMEEADVARQQIEEEAKKFYAFTGAQKPAANAIFILVMGMTGAGKSSFVASCTGKQVIVGHTLHSCTSDISIFDFELDGNQVYLIDTPGFDDTDRSDVETLRVLATYLSASYAQNVFIHGIIYLHSIAKNRMSGSSKRNIDMFKALCGYSTYSNVAIATTFWNEQDRQSFLQRETELKHDVDFFGGIIGEGARLFRHCEFGQDAHQLRHSAQFIVRHVVRQSRLSPVVLLIQHELVDEGKTLDQTAAGIVVAGEMQRMAEKHKRQLETLQKDMNDMMNVRDSNQTAAIEALTDGFQQQLSNAERQREVLESSMAELQRREQQDLLNRLEKIESTFELKLQQREEELKHLEESLRLVREEAAHPGSVSRLNASQELLLQHETEVAHKRRNVQNGQRAYKDLRGTTKTIRGGIVSGIAASVTTAVMTGFLGGVLCIIQ